MEFDLLTVAIDSQSAVDWKQSGYLRGEAVKKRVRKGVVKSVVKKCGKDSGILKEFSARGFATFFR